MRRVRLRGVGLDALLEHPGLCCRFLRDRQFWGGWIDRRRDDPMGWRIVRRRFLDNMRDSDYVFCCRGDGNFSYRIYETMSCGRIPLLLNTDCVLPYDFEVEWRALFPVVDYDDVRSIGDRLLEFHRALGPERFEAQQSLMRSMWESRISPTGYFSHLHTHFPGGAARVRGPDRPRAGR
jgi:hypothetical protein